MEEPDLKAIHFPEFEVTYRLTDSGLSQKDWNSGKNSYIARPEKHNKIVCMTSDNENTLYVADTQNISAYKAQSGENLWKAGHNIELWNGAKIDYVKNSRGIERLIVMTDDYTGIYNTKGQIIYKNILDK